MVKGQTRRSVPTIRHSLFATSGLRFLVFDELHTYRGRQGADVAMLIRRLKEHSAGPNLIHIGTSATMVASADATPASRRAAVADFAHRLFGHLFDESNVIEETLVPFTEGGEPTTAELTASLSQPIPTDLEAFRRHPLARWVEWKFGVEPEEGGKLKHRKPSTLSLAAKSLAEETGVSAERCEARLRELLSQGGNLPRDDGGRAFAFKLHQFIGQGRALFATVEPVNTREFFTEGQLHATEGRLYSRSSSAGIADRTTITLCRATIGFSLILLAIKWTSVMALQAI